MLVVALGVCAGVLMAPPMARAETRGVLELFTSQGCSSCPPADKLLGELIRDPSLVAFSLNVDYWDSLGWKDTLADPRNSERQRAYARVRGERGVYTPQLVINGTAHVVGSDKAAIQRALASARDALSVPVRARGEGRKAERRSACRKRRRRSVGLWAGEGGLGRGGARREPRPHGHLPQCCAALAEAG